MIWFVVAVLGAALVAFVAGVFLRRHPKWIARRCDLDMLAAQFGVTRKRWESDAKFRDRVARSMRGWR